MADGALAQILFLFFIVIVHFFKIPDWFTSV